MTAELHDDDRVPERTALTLVSRAPDERRRRALIAGAIVAMVALVVTGVVVMFRQASDDLATARRDTTASVGRVRTLTAELAQATDARDRSRREAAIALAALESARRAHLSGADALAAQRADLETARRLVYASLVDANARTTQLNALRSCLDGVSQALNLLSVGDSNGWQRALGSIDAVCKQAEVTTG